MTPFFFDNLKFFLLRHRRQPPGEKNTSAYMDLCRDQYQAGIHGTLRLGFGEQYRQQITLQERE